MSLSMLYLAMWHTVMVSDIIICLPPRVKTRHILTYVCRNPSRVCGIEQYDTWECQYMGHVSPMSPIHAFLVGLWIAAIQGLLQFDIVTKHVSAWNAWDTDECETCATYLVRETRGTLNSVRRMWRNNMLDMSSDGCQIDQFFCIWFCINVS